MKLKALLVLLPWLPLFLTAQNVTVAGALTGNGTYPDLGSAFTAINLGPQTGATILVSITGNTVEPATATLQANDWTALYISPSGGASRSITGSIAGPLIALSGADRVVIDGLNSGGNALTISNTSTGTASTLQFIGDARNNAVQKCTLLGSNTSTTSGTIFFSTGSGGGGNDSIAISQCTIDAAGANLPVNGIFSLGTTTAGQENSSITINANLISNFFSATTVSAGLLAAGGNSSWTVQGNRFFQSGTRTYTTANTHTILSITSGDNHQVINNVLGYATDLGTGVYTMTSTIATRLICINLGVGTTNASSVQGNTISGISLSTSSGATTTNGILCGINVTGGNVNIGTVSPNVIGGAAGTSLITAAPTTSGGTVMGIHSASTGTVSIQNNVIGGIACSGATASQAGGVICVNVSAVAASMTISGNTLGNASPDNVRGGTSGLTTGSSLVAGINLASVPTVCTVNGNVIRNLSSFGSGTAGFVRGIQTGASTSALGQATISNNQISNLTSNNANASYANGLPGVCGISVAAGLGMVVDKNQISALANTNAGTAGTVVAGIAHGNGNGTTISNNTISGLTSASTAVSTTAPSVCAGVIVRSGSGNIAIRNNMIALGAGQSTNTAFLGIMCNHGSTPDPTLVAIYHNSISISGTVTSGAQPTIGIARTDWGAVARLVPMDIRNNLVSNTRTGGTGLHMAIANNFGTTASATGWGATASNNNILNAAAANVGWWTTARQLCDWKSASAGDAASFTGVPVTFVNVANDLHLNMALTPNAIESAGQTIASVTTDIDGNTRPGPVGSVNGGALAPDIGADEFDGVIGDFAGPAITYTPLPFICTLGDRTLSVNIIDASGVPTTGGLVPRLYYRKNAGAWQSSSGTLMSGTGTNGSWNFLISAAAMGGVALGDIITYYVIAQDIASPINMNTNPVGCFVATDVTNVTTAPTNVNSYAIGSNLSGTYTVGISGNYATLTAAANAYNTGCLTGPVTMSLIDAAYPTETFPITFTQNPYSSSTNTLLVKPTLASTVVSGASTFSILQLSGADFVTIDGSIGNTPNTCCPYSAASRDLTFQNTSTGTNSAVVWLGNTASGDPVTNCTVRNIVAQGNSSTTTLVGMGAGSASIGLAGVDNDNLAFVNNDIRACQLGIYVAGQNAANKNQNLDLSMNLINGAGTNGTTIGGIYAVFVENASVNCNRIDNVTNGSNQDIAAINLGFAPIGGFNSTTTGNTDGITNAVVKNNIIGSVAQSNTFSAVGIALGNTATGTTLISNNMISGVMANGTGGDIAAGIVLGGGAGQVDVEHNTVYMQDTVIGATAGTQTSACLAVTAATAMNALNVRNNVLVNAQLGNTGATTRFAAIALRYGSPYTGLLSNYNDLYAAGPGPGTYAVGLTGGVTGGVLRTTLLDWQTETGQDANSVNVQPSFTSVTDLHLTAAGNQPLSNSGTPLPNTTADVDCDNRSLATPDLGADEFLAACVTASSGLLLPGDSTSCAADSLVLAAASFSTGIGSSYQWQSSPFGANTWSPVVGANDPENFPTGLVTAPTDYRLVVTCATNGSTAFSDTLTFFVGDSTAPNAVCQPQFIMLDTNGQATVPAADYDDASSDNCSTPFDLTFAISQDSFDCASVGVVNLVLTVTDLAGNSSTCATTLTVTAQPLTATVTSPLLVNGQNVSCNGGTDGTATVTPVGGCPSYTYLWSDNQTTATATGLAAGTYSVTVTDGSGQADTLTVVLTEPAAALATTTGSTLESCVPGGDGTASVSVTGGSPGYTYLWTDGQTTATAVGLSAGNHTVTVTDIAGCTTTASVTVQAATPPAAPVITQNGNTLECATCNGNSQWSYNGNAAGTGATQPILGAGTYLVTVTDSLGCSATSQPFVVVGIDPANLGNAMEVWPNPTDGTAFVRLSSSNIGNCSLSIMDLRGKRLFQAADVDLSDRYQLDLGGLSAGTYLVVTEQEGIRRTVRLVLR